MIEQKEGMDLELLVAETMIELEKSFYKDPIYLSYSSINKLLWNPAIFYQLYVLKNRPEERIEKSLINGKVIHALLLEQQEFDNNYIVSPTDLPSGNIKIVADKLFKVAKGENVYQCKEAILKILKEMDYHQSLKTDDSRLAKIYTNEFYNYWSFLHKKEGKTLIDQECYNYCMAAVEMIRLTPNVCELLGCNVTPFDNKEVYNEIDLEHCTPEDYNFGLKGRVDNIVIDHDRKTIFINDLKTTTKGLDDFKNSVEYWNYWIQACIYIILVGTKFENLNYQIKFHFIVVDGSYNVYAFPVSQDTLSSWGNKLQEVFNKVEWHFDNKRFDLPYDYANNLVIL